MNYYRSSNIASLALASRFERLFTPYRVFAGTTQGVYATENPDEITVLDGLVDAAGSGVNSISESEYQELLNPPPPAPSGPVIVTGVTLDEFWEKMGLFCYNHDTSLAGVTSLTVNAVHLHEGVDIETPADLVSISFPNLIGISNGAILQITGGQVLELIELPKFVADSGTHRFSGNALTEECVNAILAIFAAASGFTSGNLFLNGGTNAAPSGQGIADKAILIGRGVGVNTN